MKFTISEVSHSAGKRFLLTSTTMKAAQPECQSKPGIHSESIWIPAVTEDPSSAFLYSDCRAERIRARKPATSNPDLLMTNCDLLKSKGHL
jgi:hypothetical protein